MSGRLPKLTPRLETAASFVRRGVKMADVGTDHAYLPVYLLNSDICKSAVASDIKKGPLERAMLTSQKYGSDKKMKFLLTDGLLGIEPDEADDIVIAGMGGEMIQEIIGRCAWLKNPKKHLVLQPMTAQEELRAFLCENGFKIEKEAVAAEKKGEKLYLVISAYYDGEKRRASALYRIVGELARCRDENWRAYLEARAHSLEKKAQGLAHAKNMDENEQKERREAQELAAEILEICRPL